MEPITVMAISGIAWLFLFACGVGLIAMIFLNMFSADDHDTSLNKLGQAAALYIVLGGLIVIDTIIFFVALAKFLVSSG